MKNKEIETLEIQLSEKLGLKFCKDCRYSRNPDNVLIRLFMGKAHNQKYAHCFHPQAIQKGEDFLVDGEVHSTFCSIIRGYGGCGAEGKWFEPKLIAELNKEAMRKEP